MSILRLTLYSCLLINPSLMRSLWLKAFLCLAFFGISGAAQSTAALEQSFWRDSTGSATFEDIKKLPFTPFEGVLTKGYDKNAAYWLKLRIPASETEHEWVLRFEPSWHDDLRLFDPLDQSYKARASGDMYPSRADEFFSLSPSFKLLSSIEPRDIYIRVQSIHSYQLNVELIDLKDAERSERLRLLIIAMYLILMFFALLLAALIWFTLPSMALGLFLISETCALIYTAHFFGLVRVILDNTIPNTWLHHAHVLSMLFTTISITQFYAYLLIDSSRYRWATVTLYVSTSLPVVALTIYLMGNPTQALEVNTFGIGIFSIVVFLIVWFGLTKKYAKKLLLPTWALRVFFSLILFIGVFNSLPLLGHAQASKFSMWLFVLHGPMLLTFSGIALTFRYRQLISEQEREVRLAQMTVEREKAARSEQSKLLAMINHEVKTPMAVLKLMLSGQPEQAKAEAQVDAVVTLIERCLMLDQLNDLKDQLTKERFVPGNILQECIRKTLAKERFHLTAATDDEVLGDSVLYSVIVSNLLDNALKYSPADSAIQIELNHLQSDGKPCICLSVTNNIGRAGLPDTNRMFDKYYRADSARHISGTGLGLYLVRSLAQWLGGKVSFEADSTKVCFQVCIPR